METNPNSRQASRQRQKRVAFLPDNKEGNELLNRKVRVSMVYLMNSCVQYEVWLFAAASFGLSLPLFDCLCKPHALTYILIASLSSS